MRKLLYIVIAIILLAACVGNGKVYLIEDNIDLTLQYIHEHYDPNARGELVEPLSSETGMDIYRILK